MVRVILTPTVQKPLTKAKGKGKAVEKSVGKTFYGCDYRSAPCGTMADWKDSDDNWKDFNVERQNMNYKARNSSA